MKTLIICLLGLYSILILSCSSSRQDQESTKSNTSVTNIQFLSNSQLRQLNPEELRIVRSEVLARKGYKFSSHDLHEYFSQTKWYEPKSDNADSLLNPEESNYIKRIKTLEENLKKVNPFEFTIDEDYLKGYNYNTLGIKKSGTKVANLQNPKFTLPKWEDQFSYVREKAVYYQWETFYINDSINVKIISSEWPDIEFDGKPEVLFLVTYLNDSTEIDCQRVGLSHTVSDVSHFQYSTIQNGLINSNSEIITIGEDGELIEQRITEKFRILANGRIDTTSR